MLFYLISHMNLCYSGHWMLCVIDPHKTIVYWLDPLLGSVRDDIENVINS